jgi:hypothetical protein
MNDLALFLLARLADDPDVERSLKRAIDAALATPGGEPAALLGMRLRAWETAELRTDENWREFATEALLAHEAGRSELPPNGVGESQMPCS